MTYSLVGKEAGLGVRGHAWVFISTQETMPRSLSFS